MLTIRKSIHLIAVPDCKRTADYYCNVLGFQRNDQWPDSWEYIERDGFAIGIQEVRSGSPVAQIGEHS